MAGAPIPSITGGPAAASATSEASQTVGGVNFTGGAQIGTDGPAQNPVLITRAITKVVAIVSIAGLIGWIFTSWKKGK